MPNTRRATDAMWFGIVGILLVFPFGVLLGPATLFTGISALRRALSLCWLKSLRSC